MSEPPAAEPSERAGVGRPKVIYVMGSGRSGSTILGVALGNCRDVFFVGELDRWLPGGGRPVLGGRERRAFWRAVAERVDVPEELRSARARDTLERAAGPLRPRGWRGRRRMRRQWRSVTGELLDAISEVSGAGHIVDTSHFPLRARELRGIPGVDVYLLFLTRDPRTMLSSFVRRLGPNEIFERVRLTVSTNLDLWLTHLLAVLVFVTHPRERRLFLRFEDLTAEPQRVLGEVLRAVGLPGEVPDLTRLDTGLALGGNALLRSETVSLKGDTRRPGRGSRLTELLQAPLTALMSRMRPAVAPSSAAKG